jgi:hypothetical protein
MILRLPIARGPAAFRPVGEFASIVGTVPGRGSALLLVIAVLATTLIARFRSLRDIERVLPDVGVTAPLPAGGEP